MYIFAFISREKCFVYPEKDAITLSGGGITMMPPPPMLRHSEK